MKVLGIERGGVKPRKDISQWSELKDIIVYMYDEGYEKMERTTASSLCGLAASAKGMSVGAAAGTVLGPIGTAVGGFVGGVVGYIAGSSVVDAAVSGLQKVRKVVVEEVIKPVWEGVKEVAHAAWEGIKSFGEALFSWL